MSRFVAVFAALFFAVGSVFGQQGQADENVAVVEEDLAADATLYPVPLYAGDFATRAAFTGDWGGVRTKLAEDNGLQFSVDVTQYYQGVWDGGRSGGAEYSGTSDYRLKLDTGKAGLWPGGFIEIHGETYWGESVNGRTGAVLPVNIDPALSAPGGAGTYLSHVTYTQFLSEKFALIVGRLDTTVGDSNRFAHISGNQQFMNLGFSLNPVLLLTAPYSPLGAGVVWLPVKDVSLAVTVLDTDGAITESGFDTVFNGNTTVGTELGINTHFFDQPGRHTFSGSYSNREFVSLDQDPRILIPGAGAVANTEDGSWALAYNFDQYIVSDRDDPSQGWGVFGRFGISDGDANPIHQFYSIGLGGTGLIPGRDRDRFGVGYYYLRLSDRLPGLLTNDSESGVEVFYNVAVTPWFGVTADLQVIDGAGRFSDTALVGGLRARLMF